MRRRSFLASGVAAGGSSGAQSRDAHPRLFWDAARVQWLREAIAGTHSGVWKPIRERADMLSRKGPPPMHEDPDSESLWQREVGNAMPYLAMAYRLTGSEPYLDSARKWALASCGYPHWGSGRYEGMDLAAGHQLFGLALVYDWLYDDLGGAPRDTIAQTLRERGAVMYKAASESMYWRRSYLQNHLWVNVAGLAAAALAMRDEPAFAETARAWIDLALDKFRRTEAALGSDGASHEGVGYWSYGVEYILKFWDLAAAFTSERMSSPWWAKTAAYRLYLGLPRGGWARGSTIVDIADCPRSDWYGPEYLLRRLAALHHDPHAQGLADEIAQSGFVSPAAGWLNLLWWDPKLAGESPARLPTLRHFEDLGIVSARSSWAGDESLVVFKCGPPLGREGQKKFDYDAGSGHVHPDANHFVLFGAGEWLLRDDGYAWKETGQHNTLLVDGAGQLGEGSQWFRGIEYIRTQADPRITSVRSGASADSIEGDAATAYPAARGVKKFVRRLHFLKPDVLIVDDEVETDAPRHLELRFHPEHPFVRQGDGSFLARGSKAQLRAEVFQADGVTVTAGPSPARGRHGEALVTEALRLETTRDRWRSVVAFSWTPLGVEPQPVTCKVDDGTVCVDAGGKSIKLR